MPPHPELGAMDLYERYLSRKAAKSGELVLHRPRFLSYYLIYFLFYILYYKLSCLMYSVLSVLSDLFTIFVFYFKAEVAITFENRRFDGFLFILRFPLNLNMTFLLFIFNFMPW